MKIICIGMPRTGTGSLHRALSHLGIKSIHLAGDKRTVQQLRAGDYKLDCLKENDAISDAPIPAIFPQLDTAFPGSKFIFTSRSLDSWIESHKNVAFNRITPTPGSMRDFYRSILYGVNDFSEDRFRFVYSNHSQLVKSYFQHRSQDLLSMDLTQGDGWEKLCAFIDKPVPNSEFPRTNRSRPLAKAN
jgi:hypothetical protein